MMLFNPKTQSSKSPAGPEAALQVKQPAEIQARPAESVQHSIIPDGMQISGDLVSTGDINVKGKIEGNITCRTLTLEGEPIIGGSVRAETIRICGSFNGDVLAKKVALTKTAKMVGDIHYKVLEMEVGASFEGALHHLDESSADEFRPGWDSEPTRNAVSGRRTIGEH